MSCQDGRPQCHAAVDLTEDDLTRRGFPARGEQLLRFTTRNLPPHRPISPVISLLNTRHSRVSPAGTTALTHQRKSDGREHATFGWTMSGITLK